MTVDSENRCAKCERSNPSGMRFCGFCGSPLAAAYAPESGEPEAPVAVASAPTAPPVEDLDRTQEVRLARLPSPASPVNTAQAGLELPTRIPVPAGKPAGTVPPPANIPTDPVAREVERDRLMSQVNLFRARGQVTDARETLEKALYYADVNGSSLERRARATMLEELGDLLMIEEFFDEAAVRYQEAIATDGHRAALVEKKFAGAKIAISDKEAEKRLGQAVLKDDSITDILKNDGLAGRRGKRNAGLAMFLSVIVPGFGQFYNGQFVKGAILLGTFVLALLVISLSPEKDNLFHSVASLFALKQSRLAPPSPLTLIIGGIALLAWLYSLVDAPYYANQTTDDTRPLSVMDKSGWEP